MPRTRRALGFSIAAAIGAWYASPGSKIVAAMGDGSFGFAVGELETVVRKQIPVTLIVFSNASYGWIKASQKSGYGARYFSVDFNRTDHARIAEAYGLKAWTIEDPADVETAIKVAIAHDGPSLINVISQPLEDTAVPVTQWMG